MDGTATAILVLSLMATVAAMALPPSYPNAPLIVWRALLWFGVAGMILASIYLVVTNMSSPKIWPIVTMATAIVIFIIGAVWYSVIPTKEGESNPALSIPQSPQSEMPRMPTGIYVAPGSRGNVFLDPITSGY